MSGKKTVEREIQYKLWSIQGGHGIRVKNINPVQNAWYSLTRKDWPSAASGTSSDKWRKRFKSPRSRRATATGMCSFSIVSVVVVETTASFLLMVEVDAIRVRGGCLRGIVTKVSMKIRKNDLSSYKTWARQKWLLTLLFLFFDKLSIRCWRNYEGEGEGESSTRY